MDIKVENNESDENAFEVEYIHLYCRVCLQLPQSTDILDVNLIYDEDEGLTYKDVFKICTEIDLLADINLPNQLCKNCGLELQMAYDFHKKVKEAKRLLTHIMKQCEIQQQENESSIAADDRSIYVEEFEEAEINLVESPEVEIEQLDLEEMHKVEEFQTLEELQNVEECEEGFYSDLIEETKTIAASDITLPYRVLDCPLTANIDNNPLEDLQNNELNEIYKDVLVENPQKSKDVSNVLDPMKNNLKGSTVYPLCIVKSPVVSLEMPNEVQKIRRHPCDMCNKTFGNQKSMLIHRGSHCRTQRSNFVCPESKCGRIYSSKQACDVHVKQVHQKDGLVCSVCNKRFAIIQTLEVHMRYHTGDFPFSCSLCDKKFAQKGHLTTHMQVKHNNLRYFCTENGCGKVFKNSVSLRNHRYVHSGMPFSCEYCKKGYPQKAKLRIHISTRHGILKTLDDLESMRVFKDSRTRHSLFEIQAQFSDETEDDADKMVDNHEEDDLIV